MSSSLSGPLKISKRTDTELVLRNIPFREGAVSLGLMAFGCYPVFRLLGLIENEAWEQLFFGKLVLLAFALLLWAMSIVTLGEYETCVFTKGKSGEKGNGEVVTTNRGLFTHRKTKRKLNNLTGILVETTAEKARAFRLALQFNEGTILPLRECFVYEFNSPTGEKHRKVAEEIRTFLELPKESVIDFEWPGKGKGSHDLFAYGAKALAAIKAARKDKKEKQGESKKQENQRAQDNNDKEKESEEEDSESDIDEEAVWEEFEKELERQEEMEMARRGNPAKIATNPLLSPSSAKPKSE